MKQNQIQELISLLSDKKKMESSQRKPLKDYSFKESKKINYIFHDPQQRLELAKLFHINTKKRQIARTISQIESLSNFNEVPLKQHQRFKQQLYLDYQQQESPLIYLGSTQKIYDQKYSPSRRCRTFTTKQNQFSKTIKITQNESPVSVKRNFYTKHTQTSSRLSNSNFFTIMTYKSLKYQN